MCGTRDSPHQLRNFAQLRQGSGLGVGVKSLRQQTFLALTG
jgi:hypothetical protein